jgi:hypothetical protein
MMGLLMNEMPSVWRIRKYVCETIYEEFEDLSETNIALPKKWIMDITQLNWSEVGELFGYFKSSFQNCVLSGWKRKIPCTLPLISTGYIMWFCSVEV